MNGYWKIFCVNEGATFSERFHFKANRNSVGSSKNGTRNFQNSPPIVRSVYFNVTISENFEHFQCFSFKKIFLKNAKTLFKKLEYGFLVEILRLKAHHFHTKLSCQKPMLRHIEWGVQNRRFASSLFFRKFCFNFITSYEELIWCINTTQVPNAFRKRQSFIWGCFFPVSILKLVKF